ncbi:MAG TPA: hypothetical protein GYA10_01570, partial [Alphaproteobacteria bacterium]|nr:hypothetical protein [Alphaproteobacteria bacterium]
MIASYFQKARMPFAEMNAMLQQLSETGATVESVADRFIVERGAVWRPWAGLPVDPAAAAKIEPGNARRIVRALEVIEGSGRLFSSFGPGLDAYPDSGVPQIGLRWDRAALAERIER